MTRMELASFLCTVMLAVLGTIVTAVGIRGETWNPAAPTFWRRITRTGRVLLVVAATGLCVGLLKEVVFTPGAQSEDRARTRKETEDSLSRITTVAQDGDSKLQALLQELQSATDDAHYRQSMRMSSIDYALTLASFDLGRTSAASTRIDGVLKGLPQRMDRIDENLVLVYDWVSYLQGSVASSEKRMEGAMGNVGASVSELREALTTEFVKLTQKGELRKALVDVVHDELQKVPLCKPQPMASNTPRDEGTVDSGTAAAQ